MRNSLKTAVALSATAILVGHAAAEVTFYQHESFGGRAFTTYSPINNLDYYGLNDRASSVIVDRQRYEVCEDSNFRGHCVVLRPGSYPSLRAMGLNNRVSSVRPINWNVRVDEYRFAPPPVVVYDYRRRGGEPLYEANVIAARAVVGPPNQRCWIERERVSDGPNVGGAVVGAVIGGILGHQIGAGSGQDLATAGGVVAGAAIGANVDDGRPNTTRVQRCTYVRGDERPDYWDVIYVFRGAEHHVQMDRPPGRTVTVNQYGEPREG